MSESNIPQDPLTGASREEMQSVLFANLVFQQANLALMCLGRVAHPESGKTAVDLDAAQMLIDQMEMIEVKTRGNLSHQEQALLKQSLATVRMAFVEVVERGEAAPDPQPPSQAGPAPAGSEAGESSAPAGEATPQAPADESRKKFTKKY